MAHYIETAAETATRDAYLVDQAMRSPQSDAFSRLTDEVATAQLVGGTSFKQYLATLNQNVKTEIPDLQITGAASVCGQIVLKMHRESTNADFEVFNGSQLAHVDQMGRKR